MSSGIKGYDLLADYFDVFNEEVRQFFDPFASNDGSLRSSRVHMDSRVRWLQDNIGIQKSYDDSDIDSDETVDSDDESSYETAEEYEEEIDKSGGIEPLGTFWSSSEKTLFFHCLSRYSIHRFEEWRDQLPAKSKFEIMVYYKVLQDNLNLLKRSDMKRFGGILSRTELPIAYEMDEFFIDFEEEMSARIRLEADKKYTEEEESDGLISLENWNKRWLPIYSRTAIEELSPVCKEPLPFSQDAIVFLTKCCKDYTKRVLTSALLNGLEKVSVPTAMFCEKEDLPNDDLTVTHGKSSNHFPRIVTKETIANAVTLLKQEGFETPTLGETVLRTLEKFQLKYQEKGKLFKNKHVTMSLVSSLISNFPIANTTAYHDKNESHRDPPLDLIIAQKLHKLNGGPPPRKKQRLAAATRRFPEDDTLDRIDNPLELDLCDWETQLIDAADTRKSRVYQHTLLAYFSRNTEPLDLKTLTTDLDMASSCPVPSLTSSMVNRYLHTNT